MEAAGRDKARIWRDRIYPPVGQGTIGGIWCQASVAIPFNSIQRIPDAKELRF
jgi:hypothetical protein